MHHIFCNYQNGPIGGKGCTCVVTTKKEEGLARSLYQQFKDMESSDISHYLQAELIGVKKAMDILKELKPNELLRFDDLLRQVVEYVEHFPNLRTKFRDMYVRLMHLENYGLIRFEGPMRDAEDTENLTVRITPKGFLALPHEYFLSKD